MTRGKFENFICSQGVDGCNLSADGTLTCPDGQLYVANFEYTGQPAPSFVSQDTPEKKSLIDMLEQAGVFGVGMRVPLCKLKILEKGEGTTDIQKILDAIDKNLDISIRTITCDMNQDKTKELNELDELRQQEFGQKN